MKPVIADKNLIAYCGLYCGACKRYLEEKCPGCRENSKATWCQVRTCNIEKHYHSCADCSSFTECKDCKKLNNIISKIFSLIFRSDRMACIRRIKKIGPEAYAREMTKKRAQSIKK